MADNDSTSDILDKLEYLDDTKQQIRTALNNKGLNIDTITPFRNYATEIDTLHIGTDTTDADATSYDIISPRTAYVNDQKITGRIPKIINDFSFDNQEISLLDTSNKIKDYIMTDERIFHEEYLSGIDLDGKDFLIYMKPNKDESQAIVFTWNNLETLKITFNNNTMILNSYKDNTMTDSLITYTDLFLSGTPTKTIGTYTDNYFGNESYYSTTIVKSTSDNTIIFNKTGSLTYNQIQVKQSLDETKAIQADTDNIFNIGLSSIMDVLEPDEENIATASDIVRNKVAYFKGNKIIGGIEPWINVQGSIVWNNNNQDHIIINDINQQIQVHIYNVFPLGTYVKDCHIQIEQIPFSDLVSVIGLTADKIKKGETILGVTGTYEGSIPAEEVTEINQNLNSTLGNN